MGMRCFLPSYYVPITFGTLHSSGLSKKKKKNGTQTHIQVHRPSHNLTGPRALGRLILYISPFAPKLPLAQNPAWLKLRTFKFSMVLCFSSGNTSSQL